MSDLIRVGVIGCGEIAQLMHLPFLDELPRFEICAVCDLSASTLAAVGDRFGVRRRFEDYRELLSCSEVDAVIVSNYDHAPVVRDALRAGKHVLVEKPLGFTVAEMADLPGLAQERGLVALVGYMKLFDPGYEFALERFADLGELGAIHVHDFAGRFDRHGPLYHLIRSNDVAPDRIAAEKLAVGARIESMLGPAHAGLAPVYSMLLMLASHDIAVLRNAFGYPESIAFARAVGDGQLLAVLDYPNGVPCTFEVGVGYQFEWWDEWLCAYGREAEVRVDFAHPYVRYAPSVVRIRESVGASPSQREVPVSHDAAFRRELEHFADCIANGAAVRSSLGDAVADVELARGIILAMPPLAGDQR